MAGLVQHLDELEFTKDKKKKRESIIFHILSYIKMLKSNLM